MSVSYGAITVGATATLILGSNPNRRGAVIENNGTVILYIGFDSSVTTSNGIAIVAGGNYINSADGECYKGAYYGITASSTCDCRYQEWTP
jgi:hypothetical protein